MKSANTSKLVVIAVLCSVIFFIALTLFEAIPEIPVDIDFKPFFIPLAFTALVPRKFWPLFAVSMGAMLGEFLRDLLEGYEIDDPIGAIGYVVGFMMSGYIIGSNPLNKIRLFIAAIVAGFVHAVIEASSFIIFSTETFNVAVWAAIGNTITDGLIMGAIPLILIMPHLYGRVERYFGFAPRGKERNHKRRRDRSTVSAS
ncbi:hypothetical protein [Fischerella sp. PCC 9605]|uniref:hypothetical protein n=1 Tax=Fischerella sp. PCC 9605 TaxID=1173024 RepID=UPI0004AD83A3|nr:hypothetical protein [Fischerella sp. PCC 9605]